MKKKFLALASAAVLTLSMSMTAFAANSPSAEVIASTVSGQTISEETLEEFVQGTTITTEVEGTTITPVEKSVAVVLVAAANEQVGANATIATMVDINVPEGTGTATFTLGVPGLVEGQSVTVFHVKSDGTLETLPISAVNNGSVTFTMSSYSPVAVVVNATAPKTGEVNTMAIWLIVIVGIAGACGFGRKYVRG